MGISTITKEYDPHLLYHAINITVELKYHVPMERVYSLLDMLVRKGLDCDKIPQEKIISTISALGSGLENSIPEDDQSECTSLQDKIKELLRILGCTLSDAELNQILKGELSVDQALSKHAKSVWLMVFDIDENGKCRPNKEIVNCLTVCAHQMAIQNIETSIQRVMENRKIDQRMLRERDEGRLPFYEYTKNFKQSIQKSDEYLKELDKKRIKLKLYIAHMQGYDKDRDRDGGRGIDLTTGEIIDFSDIYIADKYSSSFKYDYERDGIDVGDLI